MKKMMIKIFVVMLIVVCCGCPANKPRDNSSFRSSITTIEYNKYRDNYVIKDVGGDIKAIIKYNKYSNSYIIRDTDRNIKAIIKE